MPVIIKNGKVYGDRSVTLSQAEYNALSEVEKNNGTTYYIYDVNSFVQANEVGLDGGTVEDLAGSVATIETSPATAAHSFGEFILWNGTLYSVTAAISVGETLTVGSNITATSAGEELQALKNGLTPSIIGTKSSIPISQASSMSLDDSIENYRMLLIMLRTSNNRCGSLYVPVVDILSGGYGSNGNSYVCSFIEYGSTTYSAFIQFYFSSATGIAIAGSNQTGWTGNLKATVYGIK